MKNQTKSFKKSDIESKWYIVDATDLILGRMSTQIANYLRGKNKPQFSPNADCGDNIIVINAEKIALTGKKMSDKRYYHHTGFPGGLKETSPEKILEGKHQHRIVEMAVKRMLPKNKLQAVFMKKLHVYAGSEHPHTAQKPEALDIASMNNKNKKRG